MRSFAIAATLVTTLLAPLPLRAQSLPGTESLTTRDDLAKTMVEGINRYLDRHLAKSHQLRDERWQADAGSPAAYEASLKARRERLAKILGVVDRRLPPELEFVATDRHPALVFFAGRLLVRASRSVG